MIVEHQKLTPAWLTICWRCEVLMSRVISITQIYELLSAESRG
jgi:hypothetical protein